MGQKEVFLTGEGDAWYERNAAATGGARLPEGDLLLGEIRALTPTLPAEASVLEIGCGEGTRLAWLNEHAACRCRGIDPSARAVSVARSRGVDAEQGTADGLPFGDQEFDIVLFGFCLYLCDREDLFRIASEADRVLRNPGWLLIHDFYSPSPVEREYHHRPGLYSYKMDYRGLFSWHPAYSCYSHRVHHHSRLGYTDDVNEWIAVSVLRKRLEQRG